MTDVRVFKVENTLAAVVKAPGGKTIEQAVHAAEARIETVRESSIAALGGKVEQLTALVAAGRSGANPAPFGAIYDLSNAIYGIAGTFELKALTEASFSLCDLADTFRGGEAPSWPAIDVHVDGIRLLTMLGARAGEAGAESILEGLRRVRARVLAAG